MKIRRSAAYAVSVLFIGAVIGCMSTGEPRSEGEVERAMPVPSEPQGSNAGKVTICHEPPGDPGNAKTIEVSKSALPAHRIAGDGVGACECGQDLCELGGALDPACDECVGAICAVDLFCCLVEWDATCITEVRSICGASCATCHDLCETGLPLLTRCDPCVKAVCEQDPFCCDVLWDSPCVARATSICGQTCP